MAAVIPQLAINNSTGKRKVQWLNGNTADGFEAHKPDVPMAVGAITVVATNIGGATFGMSVSCDGTEYSPLKDTNGNEITAAGTYEISSAVDHIKPDLSTGTLDDWSVSLVYWG